MQEKLENYVRNNNSIMKPNLLILTVINLFFLAFQVSQLFKITRIFNGSYLQQQVRELIESIWIISWKQRCTKILLQLQNVIIPIVYT